MKNTVKWDDSKWYFPSGEDLEKTSSSDGSIESFRDKPITSLAREICQNSIDASDKTNNPVKVKFDLMKIKSTDVPGYKHFKEEMLPLAEDTWPNEEKTKKLIKKMKSILDDEYVNVLKISDENTTGLEPENWKSLIEQVGSSVKSNDYSGGSFGIGKAAPFAVSDLRMVFYNTMSTYYSKQSIGVSKFVSVDLEDNLTTQSTGYFAKGKKEPFDNGVEFDANLRTQRGTDIYIIGFDDSRFENWQRVVLHSCLDNFLMSIFDNKLEVEVSGELLTKSNIGKYINEIKANKKLSREFSDLISYYSVLTSENSTKLFLPQFPELGIVDDEAYVLLSNDDECNNRTVLMTRSAGMKIFDKKSISGIIKFSGVFRATGSNINKVLKEVENPNHDNWSADRAHDKQLTDKFLKSIYQFIKSKVKELYEEKIENEVDAFGLSDFLPDDVNEIKSRGNDKVKLIDKKVKVELSKKEPKKKSSSVRKSEVGEITDEQLIEMGVIDGDTGGSSLDGGKSGNKVESDSFNSAGELDGDKAFDKDGDGFLHLEKIKRKSISEIVYRVLEVDSSNGKYKIILKPNANLKNVKIEISIVGDSSNVTPIRVVNATGGSEVKFKRNTIYVSTLKKLQWETINIDVSRVGRLKLEVRVHAN